MDRSKHQKRSSSRDRVNTRILAGNPKIVHSGTSSNPSTPTGVRKSIKRAQTTSNITTPGERSNVQVSVRVRPLGKLERTTVDVTGNTVCIINPRDAASKEFTFDHAYGTDTGQQQIYDDIGFSIVQNALEGYNCCILAYGQTGSGKTHTMMGNNNDLGLIPRISQALMSHAEMKKTADAHWDCHFEISYLEIYAEKVYDLLGGDDPLKVRFHEKKGVYVEKLRRMAVETYDDILRFMKRGNETRTVAATKLNTQSSRSHAIFSIKFKQYNKRGRAEKTAVINLVDLAGSERVEASGVTGIQFQEAIHINRSLVTLGIVISKLVRRQSSGDHIPFRDSALTFILSEHLGGNSKTFMIAAISPAANNYNESLNTLRYADNAKRIVNTVTINESCDNELIMELKAEIEHLRVGAANDTSKLEELAAHEALLADMEKSWAARLEESRDMNASLKKNLADEQNLTQQLSTVLEQKDRELMSVREQARREIEAVVQSQLDELKKTHYDYVIGAEREITTLRKKFSQSESDNTQKSRIIDDLRLQISDACAKRIELEHQVETMTRVGVELMQVKSENATMTAELTHLRADNAEHATAMAKINKHIADIHAQFEHIQAEHTQKEAELAAAKKELATAKIAEAELDQFQTDNSTLAVELSKHMESVISLEAQLAETTAKVQKLSIIGIRRTKQHKEKLSAVIKQHVEAINTLTKQHAEAIDTLTKQHEEKINTVAKQHAEKIDTIIQQHNEKVQELSEIHDATMHEFASHNETQLRELAIQHAEKIQGMLLQHELDRCELLASRDTKIQELKEQKEQHAAKVQELQRTIGVMHDEQMSMRKLLDDLKHQHSDIFNKLHGNLTEKEQELLREKEQAQSLSRARMRDVKSIMSVLTALKKIEKDIVKPTT